MARGGGAMIMEAADPTLLAFCRCCSAPMEATLWREYGYHIVTCRRFGCKLRYHTFTSDTYAAQDLTAYGVVPMLTLDTGDCYLDQCGFEVAVLRRDGDHAFVKEERSDWMIEIELDADLVVPIVRRATFCLLRWAVDYLDNRRWRAAIGE